MPFFNGYRKKVTSREIPVVALTRLMSEDQSSARLRASSCSTSAGSAERIAAPYALATCSANLRGPFPGGGE